MTLAVQVNSLVKKYGSNTAVDNISFNIYKGEVFGLLGPNGAGKTTTLEIIEGLRMPTLGEVYVEGLSPIRDTKELRKVLGVQLQISALPEVMRVDEAMELICTFKGIKPRYDLLERFGLVKQKKQQYGKLSTGQKRRLQLALAICGNPKVVILDEPTAGVDVQGRAQLHNAIRELRKNGVTVVIATHDMAEAESLCDRIAIIINGKLAALGSPDEVTAKGSFQTRITIRTKKGNLTSQGNIKNATFESLKENNALWLCTDTASAIIEMLSAIDADDEVLVLRVERPSLEERFLELMEGGNS
jgi:ABC-2 type transport system ATP-binding protein